MTPITVIRIGPSQTHLVCGNSITVEATISLDIGSQKTSTDHFKHRPPTPGEMEHAIMSVEDEIAQAPAALLAGSNLFATDHAIREVALVAGLAHQPTMLLSIADVERSFDRLTYVLEGRPASSEGLPENSEFATTLLISNRSPRASASPMASVISFTASSASFIEKSGRLEARTAIKSDRVMSAQLGVMKQELD